MFHVVFRTLLLATIALPARPSIIAYTQTTTGYLSPGQNIVHAQWHEDLIFPQFNPALEELTSIRITLEQTLTTSAHLPVNGLGGTYTLYAVSMVDFYEPIASVGFPQRFVVGITRQEQATV
jgi:hypothetical protein